MPKGKPTHPDIVKRIRALWDEGQKVPEIMEALQQKFGDKIPDERTVQRYVEKFETGDTSLPWRAYGAKAEDVILLLPILREVTLRTGGRVQVRQEAAGGVLWLRRIVPDLPPWYAYRLVLAYQRRPKQDAEDLDKVLELSPWRSEEDETQFFAWVRKCRPEWTEAGWHGADKRKVPPDVLIRIGGTARVGKWYGRKEGVDIALDMAEDAPWYAERQRAREAEMQQELERMLTESGKKGESENG
jgi:hypothetical protein